MSMVLCHFAKK